DAKHALTRLYTALRGLEVAATSVDWQQPMARRFKAAMDDDFNTAEACAVLFELANELNKTQSLETATLLKSLAGVLGLLQRDPEVFLQGEVSGDQMSAEQIEQLISQRLEARRNKDFAEADRIRKLLGDHSVVLEDGAQGTSWRRG
ncbi:MAG TPA: DALR domain-containing protein, partial [Methylophilaceae bacterium]|nr:DALR domain-containing protein [Methylophilaceae bacterium]